MNAKKELIPPHEMKNAFQGTKEETLFLNASAFRSQIGVLCKYLRTDYLKVSYDLIGELFNESGHCVMIQNIKYNKMPKFDWRPPKLNESQLEGVKNYIQGIIEENGQHFSLHIQHLLLEAKLCF